MRRKQLQLPEKVLVVTGGGAGIGHATVLELLARGARIAAVDLNQEGLNETAALTGRGRSSACTRLTSPTVKPCWHCRNRWPLRTGRLMV